MIVDAHVHLYSEEGSLERLVEECKKAGIDKVCLFTGEPRRTRPSNDDVSKAFEKYPDLIIKFGYIALGEDGPGKVSELFNQGFKGLKIIRPKANYDDKRFYPVYERAEYYGMPILFHTGLVLRRPDDKYFDVNSSRMRPVYLDGIARAFPELNIIGAHLGIPWFAEACAVAWANPNVYFDLSGIMGWLNKQPSLFFDIVLGLGWEKTKEQLVYGSDTGLTYRMGETIKGWLSFFKSRGIKKDLQHKIMGKTMASLLTIDK